MVRNRRDWTEEKLDRYTKEGRGQGIGQDYNPWIKVSDFSSSGRVSRILGWKTNREHHFMSDGETRLFYLFEWSDLIVDIREQFPLIDRELCFKIAEEMGVEYPKDPKSGVPYVLSTDFMLTVTHEGKNTYEARTFKPSKTLNNKRTAMKLELERRYYAIKGIDWKIVTEKDIPKLMVKNVEWIHSAHKLEGNREANKEELHHIMKILRSKLETDTATVGKVVNDLDTEMNVELGTSLYLFKYLVANKSISVDMLSKKPLTSYLTKKIKFNQINV